jgi:hypothetical protein
MRNQMMGKRWLLLDYGKGGRERCASHVQGLCWSKPKQ